MMDATRRAAPGPACPLRLEGVRCPGQDAEAFCARLACDGLGTPDPRFVRPVRAMGLRAAGLPPDPPGPPPAPAPAEETAMPPARRNPQLERLDRAKACPHAYEVRAACGCASETRRCRRLRGGEVSLGQCLACVAGKGLPTPLRPRTPGV